MVNIKLLYNSFGEQKRIAKLLGITRVSFHNWERGKAPKMAKNYLTLALHVLETEGKESLINLLGGKNG